jgi:serine protease Do
MPPLAIHLKCTLIRCAALFALLSACGLATAQQEPASPPSLTQQEESAMRAAVDEVAPAVVQIRTIGGLDTVDRTLLADGPTTGLIVSADGYVVSSAFNFVQQPASILVTFASGAQAPAELVATDHSRMIVLLKVHGVNDLPVPTMAPVDEARVGQWAIAIGRTYRADRTNVSVGIISAVRRMFGKAIQTDAGVSTANYGGPLVDIRGRVLGLIVPMAPRGTSEVAGVEWYDSGIGFAVPLAPLAERLEAMKLGKDQHAGVLGISMVADKTLGSPAELAAVLPGGPAGQAGFKKGDRIVEIDGHPIITQTDLRFALGSRYAGEQVHIAALRSDQRIEREIALVGELEPFRHAFLGVLPMRELEPPDDNKSIAETAKSDEHEKADESEPPVDEKDKKTVDSSDGGVLVRMLYPGSAAEGKLQVGDRIVRINDAAVDSIDAAIAEMNSLGPGSEVTVKLVRGKKSLDVKLKAGRLPTNVPGELPPAFAKDAVPAASKAKPAGETVDLKLPEFPQKCRVYVPPSFEAGRPAGVLLWLHEPGDSQPEEVISRWKSICDRDGIVLVVPTASDISRWERTEAEYLARLLQRVTRQYHVDPRRVVVYGRGGGGSMALLLGLSARELVRGVAAVDAALPRTVRVPENDPTLRLAFFMELASEGALAANVRQSLEKLSAAGYPVTALALEPQRKDLSPDEREHLARWIDALDRF